MHVLVLKSVPPNSNYGQSKKGPQNSKKSLYSMGYNSLWYVKIDPSQNQDLSTSLERSYKKLLNACFSFEIRHSVLKLWAVKDVPQNSKKNHFGAWLYYTSST